LGWYAYNDPDHAAYYGDPDGDAWVATADDADPYHDADPTVHGYGDADHDSPGYGNANADHHGPGFADHTRETQRYFDATRYSFGPPLSLGVPQPNAVRAALAITVAYPNAIVRPLAAQERGMAHPAQAKVERKDQSSPSGFEDQLSFVSARGGLFCRFDGCRRPRHSRMPSIVRGIPMAIKTRLGAMRVPQTSLEERTGSSNTPPSTSCRAKAPASPPTSIRMLRISVIVPPTRPIDARQPQPSQLVCSRSRRSRRSSRSDSLCCWADSSGASSGRRGCRITDREISSHSIGSSGPEERPGRVLIAFLQGMC
jgi:hypothetical protein